MSSNTKTSSSGCFSAVFRRILCSGNLQTHPSGSDQTVELKTVDDHVKKAQVQESGPGIVARLMGLDSMPENNWVDRNKNPGPVTRSRSVNFMDLVADFDITQANQKHRRVKTTASFREVSFGSQLLRNNQNQDFLVVCLDLDNSEKNKEVAGFRTWKSEKGDGLSSKNVKQKENVRDCKKENQEKNKKISKLRNEPRRRVCSGKKCLKKYNKCNDGAMEGQVNLHGATVISRSKAKGPLKAVNQKEASELTRKKMNQFELKRVKSYSDSEVGSSSSPISVLSVNDFAAHQENGSENSRPTLELIKNIYSSKSVKHETPAMDIGTQISITKGHGKQEITKKNSEPMKTEETEYYMTEEDIKNSNWKTNKKDFKFEDFEEIYAMFGEQVLDVMLYQVTEELVRISHVNY